MRRRRKSHHRAAPDDGTYGLEGEHITRSPPSRLTSPDSVSNSPCPANCHHAGGPPFRRPSGPLCRRRLQVESAEASGTITEDESDELLLLDVIVSGTRTGTQDRVYAGIEVSITANDDDVNRAADRAEILSRVTGGPVMAVVIADRVETQQRELAARRQVAMAVHPD